MNYANVTYMTCSNCGKELLPGQRNEPECAECQFHTANGTRTIQKYNAWLRGVPRKERDA